MSKSALKIDRSIYFLIGAVVLAGLTIMAAQSGLAKHKDNIEVSKQLQQLKSSFFNLNNDKEILFKQIPEGKTSLMPIRDVVSNGSIIVSRLASLNNLTLGNVTVLNALNNDDAMATGTSPMLITGEMLKEMQVKYAFKFDTLSSLSKFVSAIPEAGGYVAKMSIKENDAVLTIKFIGVQ
jgi:outer membrane murein-binding lipoprotein Lpp